MSNAYPIYITSDATVDPGSDTFFIDATGGSVTMTLPSLISDGTKFTFVRVDSNVSFTVTIQVDPLSTEKIDTTLTSITLAVNKNTTLCSFYNNLTWYTIYGNRL